MLRFTLTSAVLISCIALIGCSGSDEPDPSPVTRPIALPQEVVSTSPEEDVELRTAMSRANTNVDEFLEALANPPSADTYFAIYARFVDGDTEEFMWLDNVRRDGDRLTGTIQNDPKFVRNVAYGESYTIAVDEVLDWIVKENGKYVRGLYSGEILSPELIRE